VLTVVPILYFSDSISKYLSVHFPRLHRCLPVLFGVLLLLSYELAVIFLPTPADFLFAALCLILLVLHLAPGYLHRHQSPLTLAVLAVTLALGLTSFLVALTICLYLSQCVSLCILSVLTVLLSLLRLTPDSLPDPLRSCPVLLTVLGLLLCSSSVAFLITLCL